jgi:tRNA(Ile)-lysidine synthase
MIESFIRYIKENSLGGPEHHLLLAVSGGIDSATMVNLYHEAGFTFSIAHCNFQLREDESEEDQRFVEELAGHYESEIFVRRFDTLSYSGEKGISVQMAARELRYDWFRKVAVEHGCDYIAVAHNRNDVAETILLNLIRGTGLKGMTGIQPRSGNIVRPLLFASRTSIEEYAKKVGLKHREDSSNNEIKYQRNLIRREIIPLLQKINPSILDTLLQEAEVFDSAYHVYQRGLKNIRDAVITEEENRIKFSIAKIISLRLPDAILYDLLSPYRFSFSDVKNIMSCIQDDPGKKFFSQNYVLIKDRNFLVIEKLREGHRPEEFLVGETDILIKRPVTIEISRLKNDDSFSIPKSQHIVALDYDRLKFPLKLRHWKEGDFFYPLGMKGRKKLSDYFIDQKINILDKEKIWLMLSGDEIVWVLGRQINDHYKINAETQNIMTFRLNDYF